MFTRTLFLFNRNNTLNTTNGNFQGSGKIDGGLVNGNAIIGLPRLNTEVLGIFKVNGILKGTNTNFLKSVTVNGEANLDACKFAELCEIRGQLKVQNTKFATISLLGSYFLLESCEAALIKLLTPHIFSWSSKLILTDTIVHDGIQVEGNSTASRQIILRGKSKIHGEIPSGVAIIDETNHSPEYK